MAKRVLAIDDETDALIIIKGTLAQEGYEVETATSGEEGLRKAAANPPDVIILDILMPEMNGAEVARKLKADPKTATIPVVMLTALSEKKYIKAALFELGVDYYVVKPYEKNDLIDKVNMAIRYGVPESGSP